MKKFDVNIPEQEIEHMHWLCEQEWQLVSARQETNDLRRLKRFLYFDLHRFTAIAFLSLMLTILILWCMQININESMTIYFISLGFFSIFEMFKDMYYHTSELCSPVYLHAGRRFLMKNIAISIIMLGMLLLISLIHLILSDFMISFIILYAYVPLFLIQCMYLIFLPYIHSYIQAMIIYITTFAIYEYIVCYFDLYNPFIIILFFIILLCFYFFNSIYQYFKIRKAGNIIWN